MIRYWVIAPYDATNAELFTRIWEFNIGYGNISIGWHELGNISDYDKDQLRHACENTYETSKPSSITRIVNMLWNFYHEIKPGDIVIARRGTKKLAAIGLVRQPGYYDRKKGEKLTSEYPEFNHANWIDVDWHDEPRDKGYDKRIAFGIQTLYEIEETEYRSLIEELSTAIIEEMQEGVINRPQFFLEKYLEQFIVDNFEHIFNSKLTLFRDQQGEIIGQQYRTDVGIIDVLAFEQTTNTFVVIELKKGRESDKVVGQILRYIGWITDELCKNGQKARGIIVCRDADDKLYYAVKATQNIEIQYYHIDFKLSHSP